MIRRITADWDFKSKFKILFYLNRIFRKGFENLSMAPTKKGYHIYMWSKCKGKKFDIRKYIGDDKKRIFLDHTHMYARNTLFNKKKKWKKKTPA